MNICTITWIDSKHLLWVFNFFKNLGISVLLCKILHMCVLYCKYAIIMHGSQNDAAKLMDFFYKQSSSAKMRKVELSIFKLRHFQSISKLGILHVLSSLWNHFFRVQVQNALHCDMTRHFALVLDQQIPATW